MSQKKEKKYCNRCNLGGVFPIIKSLKLRISLQYSAFSQTSPDSKNRQTKKPKKMSIFALASFPFIIFPILFCTFFWKVFGTLCVLLYWYYVPGDAFWSCFGLVRTSLLANSPRVQSHVHSPTDRNVLCTRAKHVEAYGSWLRCDGALLYSMQYT